MANKLLNLKYKMLCKLFPNFITSDFYIRYLKSMEVSIGKGTVIFNPSTVTIDSSRPLLIKIGEYCKITQGVIILGHDYSRSVLRRVYGEIIGEAKKTTIGDNVFIGVNSIILMGTIIGSNSIVGAGSICNGIYPENSVIAGNPAKVIMSLDEYYNKRVGKYINEAQYYAELFNKHYERLPSITDMGAFFPIYLERDILAIKMNNLKVDLSGDDKKEIINDFLNSQPKYKSFEAFLGECNFK